MPVYFIIIPIAVLAFLYFFIGWRLLKPLQLNPTAKMFSWLLVALIAFFPMTSVFTRITGVEGNLVDTVAWLSYLSLGFTSILFFFLILRDLTVLGGILIGKVKPLLISEKKPVIENQQRLGLVGESRRHLLSKSFNISLLGLTGVMTGTGIVQARQKFRIEKVAVPLKQIPEAFDGFRIVQLSDIHVGPTIKKDFVEEIVARANSLNPDMVVITGDLVDGSVDYLSADVNPLRYLEASYGKFFVTGNHEYYSGVFSWVEKVKELGMDPLLNEHRVIDRGGSKLVIGGVTDLRAEQIIPEHKTDPYASISGSPDSAPKILLAHQPVSVYEAAKAGYDLQLSGHTHGGQYFPFSKLIGLAQPFIAGLYKHENTWLYVNRGTGYWGPPIRLGSPAEITEITLTKEQQWV